MSSQIQADLQSQSIYHLELQDENVYVGIALNFSSTLTSSVMEIALYGRGLTNSP